LATPEVAHRLSVVSGENGIELILTGARRKKLKDLLGRLDDARLFILSSERLEVHGSFEKIDLPHTHFKKFAVAKTKRECQGHKGS
jgi:hypothetical protein